MNDPNSKQVGGSHYRAELQHWDVIEAFGIGYLEGCATKYVARWRKKNGLQDLEKAVHYIEKLINVSEPRNNSVLATISKILGRPFTFTRTPRGVVPLKVIGFFCDENGLGQHERNILEILLCGWTRTELQRACRLIEELAASVPP